MWIVILLLYSLGWSDLCITLSGDTIFFVLFMIACSALLGYLLKDKFKLKKLTENPHKTKTITIFLCIFYILDFLYERYIPLLNVIKNGSMYEKSFHGIPIFHFLISAFVFIYCFYLTYLFVCFKKKSLIIEYLASISIFILLFQRQNIMVVLLGSCLIILSDIKLKGISLKRALFYLALILLFILVGLYVFGLMGNKRYGIWDSHDSSMIFAVGKINDKYPSFIPKEYAWAYIYAISPLANLQHNINIGIDSSAVFGDFVWQFLPNYISKHLSFRSSFQPELLDPSLTVCTSYVGAFRARGFFGMYSVYFVQTLAVFILVQIYSKDKRYVACAYASLIYFYLLSFFVNPLMYDITSLIVVYLLIFPLIRKFFRYKSFEKVPVSVPRNGSQTTENR